MYRIIKYLIILLILQLTLSGCSDNLSGGGTDTSNSIIMGSIIDSDSLSVSGALVKILPEKYNPVKDSSFYNLIEDTTQLNGDFVIEIKDVGIYNLYAFNPSTHQSTLMKSIYVFNDDTLNLNKVRIIDPGTIKICPSDYESFNPDYFYIPGTEIYSVADSAGFAYLQRVPAIESLTVMISENEQDTTIIENISVSSNDTSSTAFRVLILVGGDTSVALTERVKAQRQLMIDSGAVVAVGNFNEFSTELYDTSKIDLIYCAYNVDWTSVKAGEFVNLPKNIALVSGKGYAKLGMIADSAGITYDTATEYNIMTGVNGNHPVLLGTGTSSSATIHAYEGGAAHWGKVENPNTTGILIGVADQKRKYVFVYQKGVNMEVGVAPAARIALFSGDNDLGDDRGKMILWRTMLWGCGRL